MSFRSILFAAAVLSAPLAHADGRAGDFDFYVLALSWSPTYCATDDDPDPQECDLRLRGFTVHGLWPQYETGYPEYCPSSFSRTVSRETLNEIEPLMPSDALARYQWRKHGICTGLNEQDYFELLLDAAGTIRIPPALRDVQRPVRLSPAAVETSFVAANPGLSRSGMSVQCRRGELTEVRICMTKDLEFRDCFEVDDDTCRSQTITIPVAR